MRYCCPLKHRAPRISFEALQSLLEYLISNEEDIFFSILFVHPWDPWNCFSSILMPSIWRTEGNGLLDSSVQFQVFKTHPHSQTPSHLETKWRTICKINYLQHICITFLQIKMGTNGDQSDHLCRIIAELQKSSMFLEMRADLQVKITLSTTLV